MSNRITLRSIATCALLGALCGVHTLDGHQHHHHHHSGGGPSSVSARPLPHGSSYTRRSWAQAFLAAGGFPVTPANVNSVMTWTDHEVVWSAAPPDGALYTHNAMNTTQPEPGSSCINSVCVRSYPTWHEGFKANLAALENGLYPDLIRALRSGRGLCGWHAGFGTWSGHGYYSIC